MALNTFKCDCLTPLHFKGSKLVSKQNSSVIDNNTTTPLIRLSIRLVVGRLTQRLQHRTQMKLLALVTRRRSMTYWSELASRFLMACQHGHLVPYEGYRRTRCKWYLVRDKNCGDLLEVEFGQVSVLSDVVVYESSLSYILPHNLQLTQTCCRCLHSRRSRTPHNDLMNSRTSSV